MLLLCPAGFLVWSCLVLLLGEGGVRLSAPLHVAKERKRGRWLRWEAVAAQAINRRE
jgi:hypothetical protein